MPKSPELVDLVVLARVIERGSFAKAAGDFGVPPSTLSRRVASLETKFGVRVLERTTRSLRPTEIGRLLAERGARVRNELEEAERTVADHQRAPRGLLRLSVPTPIADDFIGPAIAEYLRRYPDMRVDVISEDRYVDLLDEGFDAAVRAGDLPASSLGAVRIGSVAPVLAASPRYLERAPALKHPRDLAQHAIVAFGRKRKVTWRFVGRAGATEEVELVPRAVATSARCVADVVAAGVGLSLLPRFVATSANLVIVEPGGMKPLPLDLAIVTPSARPAAPKVRAFIDLMHDFVAARADMFDSVIPRKR